MAKIDDENISNQEIVDSVVSCQKFNQNYSTVSDDEWEKQIFSSNDPYRVVTIINEILSQEYDELPVKFLDIGFGYGYISKPIIDHFDEEIDLSVLEHPDLNRLDSDVFQRTFEKNNVTLYKQDLEKEINIDETFDVIVIGEVAEHLSPTKFNKILSNLHTICDGYIIVTTPNLLNMTHRRKMLFGDNILATPVVDEEDVSHDHIYFYSMKTLCNVLEHNDFQIENKKFLSAWPYKTKKAVYKKEPAKILYNLFESLVQYFIPECRQRLLIRASA